MAKKNVEKVDEVVTTNEITETTEEVVEAKPVKKATKEETTEMSAVTTLNVRKSADISSEVVYILGAGDKVMTTGKTVNKDGENWIGVKSNKFSGFCMAKFLEK